MDIFRGIAKLNFPPDQYIVVGRLPLQQLLLKQGWRLEWLQKGEGCSWKEGEYLDPPVHEIWGFRTNPNIEILLNESDAANWLYRRDTRIKLPFEDAIFQYEGVPYLAPEAVLLFKSKHIREVDNMDFKNVFPYLSGEKIEWLRTALKSQDLQHPWVREFS